MSSLFLALALAPQDLIERDQALRRRLPPALEYRDLEPRRPTLRLEAVPDFACGGFDLKASFRSLFDKNVKEEFLGGSLAAVQSQLAGSALVLACYASPTVCDALKHYRVTANAMLGSELDACRSLEQALDGLPRRSQARAIKECLDEKARAGMPLDEARRACFQASHRRGLDGTPVREIDLLKDLGLPDALVPPLSVGAGTVRAESRPTAVVEAYESRRREALRAWQEAVADPARAPLERLGPVSRAEVERIAAMDPGRREAALRSLASAGALARLVREAHDAERSLESAELLAEPELRVELERRRLQLRHEVARLLEAYELERRLHAAVADAQAAAEADVAARARERLAPRRAREAKEDAAGRVRPWGCELKKGDGDEAKR